MHGRQRRPTCAGALALLAGIAALALPAASGASTNAASGSSRCPKQAQAVLALPGNGVAKAAEAALASAPSRFTAINVKGAKIISAELGYLNSELSHQCGKRIQERTVAVELSFPKMEPDASLSEGTVFVSRFEAGYRVWEVAPSP